MAEIHLARLGRLRLAALIEGGRAHDLAADDVEATSPAFGAVYRATCETVRKGLGAFLRLDTGATGFLPAGVRGTPADAGETLLVQVKQEGERRAGKDGGKAATVSREVALAGRTLVSLPFGKGVKRSRQSGDQPLSAALLEALGALPGGFVVRRGAVDAAPAAVIEEARRLVDEATPLGVRTGGLRLRGPAALRRLLVDHPRLSITRIAAADAAETEMAGALLHRFAPALMGAVETDRTIDLSPLLAELRRPDVALPNGAGLVIEPTAALIAVDVNAGPRSDFANVNRDAAEELARQLRLRALGGQILIDFLGTERRAFRAALSPFIEALAAADPAGWQVHGFTPLGLCETTRTRRTRPLGEVLPLAAAPLADAATAGVSADRA
jgi:ribonuclease G